MKTAFILLLIPSLSFAQVKGDNVIVVKGVTFIQAANALIDLGYDIYQKDNDLQMIRTTFKSLDHWNLEYEIDIRIKDSSVYITARCQGILSHRKQADMQSDDWERARYDDKHHKAIWQDGFVKMQELANKLNVDITYFKQ